MTSGIASDARTVTLAIARDVCDAILDPALGPTKVVDLAHGKAGRAVFLDYVARATDDRSLADRSCELLDEAIEALSTTSLFPSLFYGFAGIAWAHQHLGRDPEILEPIDEALLEHISIEPWTGRCDVAIGLAGYGVYLASRPSSEVVDSALERIEHHLVATVKRADQRAWWTPPAWLPDEPLATGALGMGGIAGFLVSAWSRLGNDARSLLPDVLAWVWDNLPASLRESATDRVRWCEPSIAMTLLRAARTLDSETWWERGLALARALSRAHVFDASFLHGAAGVTHMLHRFHRATGDEELGRAARAGFERVLAARIPDQGIAGYRSRSPDTGELMGYPGITLGASGIGLVLLSAWSDVEPRWDSVFGFGPID